MQFNSALFAHFEDYTNRTVQDFVVAPVEFTILGNTKSEKFENGT
jgi:hypothetical protein